MPSFSSGQKRGPEQYRIGFSVIFISFAKAGRKSVMGSKKAAGQVKNPGPDAV
jgi:hypothetical protein